MMMTVTACVWGVSAVVAGVAGRLDICTCSCVAIWGHIGGGFTTGAVGSRASVKALSRGRACCNASTGQTRSVMSDLFA